MPHVDRMFVFGGSLAPCGGLGNGTWTFDFAASKWEKRNPSGTIPRAVPGIVSAMIRTPGKYTSTMISKKLVYNTPTPAILIKSLQTMGREIDYHMTAIIDPVRKKFVIVGAGQAWMYDIAPSSTYTKQALNTTGGSAIVSSPYPGLTYDPVSDRIVAWNGGNTIYSLNLATSAWTPISNLFWRSWIDVR